MILKRLLFTELNRTDLRQAAPDALVLFPLGAVEQHGPHLPVGTDYFTVERIARDAGAIAAAQIPLLVAPAMPFGCSQHHIPFGGTFSMTSDTYYRAVFEMVLAVVQSGFRRIFLLNGHGGNHELLQLVARDIALQHPAHVAAASYWTIAWDALVAEGAHKGMRLPGHAGNFETSLMLAQHPDIVPANRPHRDNVGDTDPRNFARPYRAEHPGFWQSIDGFTDSPDQADADRGARYLAVIAGSVAAALTEFYNASA
ncbi:MAG: creatininase family protein [Acidobacteria bacterium]|nr:creatininase family protein [Acidobacteriota bacterium]